MAKRTGIPTLQKTAKRMCDLVVKFDPVIRIVSSNDAAVISALSAALAACQVLDAELENYRDYGD